MRVWMLCEAFTLTGDAFSHQTVHESLAPWAGVYPTCAECMIALQRQVRERVRENYEGLDDAEADIESDVAEILRGVVHPDRQNDEYCRYNYSADDREVVWQTYPCDVAMPCEPDDGRRRTGGAE